MIRINMYSSAEKIKGQGVGSAYRELVDMLEEKFPNDFDIRYNSPKQADITHYHTIDPRFYVSTFDRKKRGIMVGYVHFLPDTLDGSIKLVAPAQFTVDKYVTSFYKRMDHLVVVNPCFIEDLARYGLDREKITYIPNFVSGDTFYPVDDATKHEYRNQLGIADDEFVVIGIGQVQERKGVDDFVELARRNPHIKFIWVGGFSFGKITDGYERYKEVVENPPANLTFTGIVDRPEVNKYYNAADIFLLPSFNELFPMSILESFNCHTPVMLRKLDLYRSVIKDYYIETTDVDDMSRKLNEYYNDRHKLAPYIKKSADAAKHYCKNNVAKLWFDFYNDIYRESQNK